VFDRGVDVHCDVIGGDVEMVQNEDFFFNGVPLLTIVVIFVVGRVVVVGVVVGVVVVLLVGVVVGLVVGLVVGVVVGVVVGLVVNNGRDQHTVQIFSIRQRSECQQRTVMGSSVVDQWQVAMGGYNVPGMYGVCGDKQHMAWQRCTHPIAQHLHSIPHHANGGHNNT
jgi:hypothetical protein